MNLKKLAATMVMATLLAGCASTGVKSSAPPSGSMAPCPDLPTFNGSNTNTQDLVGYNISVMQAYGKCSLKLKNLQAWVENQ